MKLATKQRAIDELRVITDCLSMAYGRIHEMDLPYIGGPKTVGLEEWRELRTHILTARNAVKELGSKLMAIHDDQQTDKDHRES